MRLMYDMIIIVFRVRFSLYFLVCIGVVGDDRRNHRKEGENDVQNGSRNGSRSVGSGLETGCGVCRRYTNIFKALRYQFSARSFVWLVSEGVLSQFDVSCCRFFRLC